VFDFDDPLSLSSRGGGRRSLTRQLRFAAMLRRCDAAFAASSYLRQLALPYCACTMIEPMTVDLPPSTPGRADHKKPIELLWIGQRSTQDYLEQIRRVLEQLGSQRHDVRLRLVAHEPMVFMQNMQELFAWYRDGKVHLETDEVFPLSRAQDALNKVLGRQVKGKVVLVPDHLMSR